MKHTGDNTVNRATDWVGINLLNTGQAKEERSDEVLHVESIGFC